MSARRESRPWPMKWIVVAIVLCLIPYTWITLRHRKPGPAHEPYADNKNRAEVSRLLDAGFRRVPLVVNLRPNSADAPTPPHAELIPGTGGIPLLLEDVLIDKPLPVFAVTRVVAPAAIDAGEAYPIQFTATVADNGEHITGAALFVRGNEVTIIPEVSSHDGSGTVQLPAEIVLPGDAFQPGRYAVTMVGALESRIWGFEVR